MSKEQLKLENQICFPLYAASRKVIQAYKPFLDKLQLTYTQYLVMLVLWSKQSCNVTEISKLLYLDSGTLTPVLKRLEKLEYINRSRDVKDERNVIITLSKKGSLLEQDAEQIPYEIRSRLQMDKQDIKKLRSLLDVMIDRL